MTMSPSLRIDAEETEAYRVAPGSLDAGVIFLCDHASNAMPAEFEDLGLPRAELERHIGYDIGTATMTRALADHFGAPALYTRFSRLLIDPNRGADDPTLVMRISDGALIPGNAAIDEARHRGKAQALSRTLSCRDSSGTRSGDGRGHRAGANLDPFLHAGDEEGRSPLACRHPLGR